MQDLITDNCYSSVKEGVRTKSSRSEGKYKEKITAVPLKENRMQTRLSRSEQIGLEKEEKTPARRKKKRKD